VHEAFEAFLGMRQVFLFRVAGKVLNLNAAWDSLLFGFQFLRNSDSVKFLKEKGSRESCI
jgi:hypothetical protein